MFEDDLHIRVQRILLGTYDGQDLDRIYLGLRDRAREAECFREIGDFVAHRDKREKGLLTQVGKDVFTSLEVWSLRLRDKVATVDDVFRAAEANCRLASDEQLRRGCGCGRQAAISRIAKAKRKVSSGWSLKSSEKDTLSYLGNRVIWRPVFHSRQLFNEFKMLILREGLIQESDVEALARAYRPLSLHAVAAMHGSRIEIRPDLVAPLLAGRANADQYVEVKLQISFSDWRKPILAPVCLFLTDLRADECCVEDLVQNGSYPMANDWNFAIEMNRVGQIARML